MIAEKLRKAVLQAAIRGKLTQQLSEDGDARDLLKQIWQEKKQLIKEGKLRKVKPVPTVVEDEVPFEIPENWVWVRFGDVFSIGSAKRIHQRDWRPSGIPFYRAREIAKLSESGAVDNELYIDKHYYDEIKAAFGVPQPGDLMVTGVGTLGKTYIVKEGDAFYYKDASVLCLSNYGKIEAEFIKLYMQSQTMKDQILSNSSGTTVATLTISRFDNYLLCLPPRREQKRIIDLLQNILSKLNELCSLEEELKDNLKLFPAQLKNSILQHAMEGKLTDQRPEDGNASDLLRKIHKEKVQLIKAGKLRKQNPLSAITEEEMPFEIPENWAWVRFGELVQFVIGKTPSRHNPTFWGPGIPWVSIADMSGNERIISTKESITPKAVTTVFRNSVSPAGTLIMSFKLTVGRVSFLDFDAVHNEAIISIFPYYDPQTIGNYLYMILPTVSCWGDTKDAIKGKTLNSTSINNLMIPLPPLNEQQRIVKRLNQLLPLCESLE